VSVIQEYEKQVYAALLGKVIGVYMGRPFEGWKKERIEERWGEIDRYVHEDQGLPLVRSDDDISGTLTFMRPLEDTGLFADTPVEAFGDGWLNYLMDCRTVLWWGGRGMSAEHTAYLNLKSGIKAPHSGSIETNGQVVAEQIGAQIFIDAFGMIAPSKPELAVRLAQRAARVAHDGEAVHAACLVAAMVSAAFEEKDMDRLLDIGVQHIPEDCLIAQVHRDVRAWCREDGDWHRTFERIDEKYGYQCFGGTCHVVPNHAIMVMAWCYAPDDFYLAQKIINTAGWDTDCNAANVGCVLGVKVGLDRINEVYDFQSPFADQIIMPTAEGTRSMTDVLVETLHIARIGRTMMGWDALDVPKDGAWHHFEMPGAQHGYMVEEANLSERGTTKVRNVGGHSEFGARSLAIVFEGLKQGRISRTSTPILPNGPGAIYGQARYIQATPRLYPGMTVTVKGVVDDTLTGEASARLFVRPYPVDEESDLVYGDRVSLKAGGSVELIFNISQEGGWPIKDFGFEISGTGDASGCLYVDGVWYSGKPNLQFPVHPQIGLNGSTIGWVSDVDQVLLRRFAQDPVDMMRIGKNDGSGVMVTGNTDWCDYTFESQISVHLASQSGLIVRYQGLQRYIALIKKGDKLQLVEQHYGTTVLDEVDISWEVDALHSLKLVCDGEAITAFCDGEQVLKGLDTRFGCGGAGFIVADGLVGFCDARVF